MPKGVVTERDTDHGAHRKFNLLARYGAQFNSNLVYDIVHFKRDRNGRIHEDPTTYIDMTSMDDMLFNYITGVISNLNSRACVKKLNKLLMQHNNIMVGHVENFNRLKATYNNDKVQKVLINDLKGVIHVSDIRAARIAREHASEKRRHSITDTNLKVVNNKISRIETINDKLKAQCDIKDKEINRLNNLGCRAHAKLAAKQLIKGNF